MNKKIISFLIIGFVLINSMPAFADVVISHPETPANTTATLNSVQSTMATLNQNMIIMQGQIADLQTKLTNSNNALATFMQMKVNEQFTTNIIINVASIILLIAIFLFLKALRLF